MKAALLLLAGFISAISLSLTQNPSVHAEQGYAVLEYAVSKSQVNVGEEFTVAIYVTGRDNTQFGKATLSVESWYPGDSNPKGYEFVRFDASGSDFPISNGQGVNSGAYNYQCRFIDRQSTTDMTGRRFVGRAVYRALHPATYVFSPHQPCRNVVESLSGNWSIIWDYSAGRVTVVKPAQPVAPAPTSPGSTTNVPSANAPSANNRAGSSNTSAANAQTAAVQGAQTAGNSQTKQSNQVVGKTVHTFAATEKQSNKDWALLAIIATILLPIAILLLRKFRGFSFKRPA